MTEREQFEAWFYASKYAQVTFPKEPFKQTAWDAWQASRRAALTEAATLCDGPDCCGNSRIIAMRDKEGA